MRRNCSMSWEEWNITNLPPDTIAGSQHCFLMLAGWKLSSDNIRISLGERKSMPSLGKASVSAAAATLRRSPQSKHRGSWGKRLKDFTEGHLVFRSLNISSVVNTIWWAFTQDANVHWANIERSKHKLASLLQFSGLQMLKCPSFLSSYLYAVHTSSLDDLF